MMVLCNLKLRIFLKCCTQAGRREFFFFSFLWSCSHSSCCESDAAIQSINYLIRFQMSLWYSGSDLTNVNVHRERVNLLFSAVKPHTVLNFFKPGCWQAVALWHLGVDCWCATFCTSLTLPNVTVSLGTSLSIKPNHSFCIFLSAIVDMILHKTCWLSTDGSAGFVSMWTVHVVLDADQLCFSVISGAWEEGWKQHNDFHWEWEMNQCTWLIKKGLCEMWQMVLRHSYRLLR